MVVFDTKYILIFAIVVFMLYHLSSCRCSNNGFRVGGQTPECIKLINTCRPPNICQKPDFSSLKCDLPYVDLVGFLLNGANFNDVNLTGANLTGAHLNGASFNGANASGIKLVTTILNEASFTKANLTNADLTYARIKGADLTDANLTGANIKGTEFEGTDLSKVNFNEVKNFTAAHCGKAPSAFGGEETILDDHHYVCTHRSNLACTIPYIDLNQCISETCITALNKIGSVDQRCANIRGEGDKCRECTGDSKYTDFLEHANCSEIDLEQFCKK